MSEADPMTAPEPDDHDRSCDHDKPLLALHGRVLDEYRGTCPDCGATDVCVGCLSADGECYCDGGDYGE